MQTASTHSASPALDANAARLEWARVDREHRELKARLAELKTRLYLSPDEQVECKKMQKLKLAKKDRLMRLAAVFAS